MTKMISNVLVVTLALSFGILLASAGVTTTLLGANLSAGKTSTNSTAKSGNMTAGAMNKTGQGNTKNASLSGHGTQAATICGNR